MKQYTTPEQTAKLIELGFERPKSSHRYWRDNELVINNNYSIGELIDLCPKRLGIWDLDIVCDKRFERWLCFLNPDIQCGIATELVDALYNLIIKLKEKGVI